MLFHLTQIVTESPQFQNPSDWKDSKNLLSHEFGHTLGAELHDDKLGYNEEMAPDLIMWSKVIFFHKSKSCCLKFPLFLISASSDRLLPFSNIFFLLQKSQLLLKVFGPLCLSKCALFLFPQLNMSDVVSLKDLPQYLIQSF